MKLFILILAISFNAGAYTFNNNFGASFKDNDVKVYIDENTTCATAGLTVYELNDLIDESIKDFWNRVPTSSLRLKNGNFSEPTTNINTGVLCAPTDDDCISSAGANVIAPVKEIIIACNNNNLNFGGSNVLAVTIPNNFSGKEIVGAVILINDTANAFGRLSRSDKIGVLAHEIGHAIGLGHTDERSALMYYRTVNLRRALGEDDIAGVSYLYPMKLDGFGLLGGCATINDHHDHTDPPVNPHLWQMGLAFLLICGFIELMKLLYRSKTRSTF